jgi:hypothetical protein
VTSRRLFLSRRPQIFPGGGKCADELAAHRLEQRARGIAHFRLEITGRARDLAGHAAQKLAAIDELNLLALRLGAGGTCGRDDACNQGRPLNSERRDTSVSGTRAVVSSQQLMGALQASPGLNSKAPGNP